MSTNNNTRHKRKTSFPLQPLAAAFQSKVPPPADEPCSDGGHKAVQAPLDRGNTNLLMYYLSGASAPCYCRCEACGWFFKWDHDIESCAWQKTPTTRYAPHFMAYIVHIARGGRPSPLACTLRTVPNEPPPPFSFSEVDPLPCYADLSPAYEPVPRRFSFRGRRGSVSDEPPAPSRVASDTSLDLRRPSFVKVTSRTTPSTPFAISDETDSNEVLPMKHVIAV